MIKLYRNRQDAQADSIEAEFKDLVLGYERVILSPEEAAQIFGADHTLPIVTDSPRIISGEESLRAFVLEIAAFIKEWQMFQGDYCYTDGSGETC